MNYNYNNNNKTNRIFSIIPIKNNKIMKTMGKSVCVYCNNCDVCCSCDSSNDRDHLIVKYWYDYCHRTSVHGIKYLTEPKFLLER